MAMAMVVVVLNILCTAELQPQVLLLGIGLGCPAIISLDTGKETRK